MLFLKKTINYKKKVFKTDNHLMQDKSIFDLH